MTNRLCDFVNVAIYSGRPNIPDCIKLCSNRLSGLRIDVDLPGAPERKDDIGFILFLWIVDDVPASLHRESEGVSEGS